jgi:hypothetical protein
MNTCKSVSKQTLSTFRMNTYAKTGGGVSPNTNHIQQGFDCPSLPACRRRAPRIRIAHPNSVR